MSPYQAHAARLQKEAKAEHSIWLSTLTPQEKARGKSMGMDAPPDDDTEVGGHIRMCGSPDRPLWVARDVCAVHGLENNRRAIATVDDDEIASVTISDTSSSSRKTITVLCVTESGLYHLTFKSRKPEAKRFRRWLCAMLELSPSAGRRVLVECIPRQARASRLHRSIKSHQDPQRHIHLCRQSHPPVSYRTHHRPMITLLLTYQNLYAFAVGLLLFVVLRLPSTKTA